MREYHRWSPAEIDLLKKHYPTTGKAETQRLLSRHSWGSISVKAHELRLFRNYVDVPVMIPKLSDFDLGYICGLIDGEGTVTITERKEKRRKIGSMYLRPALNISNSNRPVLEWCKNTLKIGKVNIVRLKDPPRIVWCFYLRGQAEILALLKMIIAYLKIKKSQAHFLLKFLESRRNERKSKRIINPPYTVQELKLHKQIKHINKRRKTYI